MVQTNSDGEATYTPSTFSTAGTKTITATETGSGISATATVEVVNIDRIDMTASEEVISEGIDTMITAIPYSNDVVVPNILIHIGGEDYVTDSEGKATHFHRGESKGLTAILANCGNFSDGIAVNDVYQYFNQAENKEYNLNYFTMLALSVIRKYNGLELSNSPHQEGSVHFIYPNWGDEEWQFVFQVVSVAKNTAIEVCGTTIGYDLLKSKPLITVSQIWTNGRYVKNVYLNTSTSTRMVATETDISSPKIKLVFGSVESSTFQSIVIDNLFIRKVGE